jgi:hypothetical protein
VRKGGSLKEACSGRQAILPERNRCKSSLLGILRKCGTLVAVLMLMSVAAAAPALAVTKGAVTPRLVYKAAGPRLNEYTWGGNMTGWKRGNLTIGAKFYVGGSQAGDRSNDCNNSTSCSLADTTNTYPFAKQVRVVVTGCGPGGCETVSKSVG